MPTRRSAMSPGARRCRSRRCRARSTVSTMSASRPASGSPRQSRELGYVPHAGARSLSLARTNAIGVVLPDLHGEFFSEIVRGMDREASAAAICCCCPTCMGQPRRRGCAARHARARRWPDRDGAARRRPRSSREALPAELPAVLINTRASERTCPASVSTMLRAPRPSRSIWSRSAASRIVHIAGPSGMSMRRSAPMPLPRRARQSGRRLRRSSRAISPRSRASRDRSACSQAAPSFDAVFAANDMMAIGALQALREPGCSVPESRGRRLRRHSAGTSPRRSRPCACASPSLASARSSG